MLYRCPDFVYLGTTDIPHTRLVFHGSKTGSHLSIEPELADHPRSVPCVVWRVPKVDKNSLDLYEGYPQFYKNRKYKDLPLRLLLDGSDACRIDAMAYVMPRTHPLGAPSLQYYDVCLEGYLCFGLNPDVLSQALIDSIEEENVTLYLN